MSILPAEAFFASCVFLVEGPSEKLFYEELATQLGVDLDFYNITILCVDGIQFKVYCQILDAMEIPWVLRTDNDVSGTRGRPDKRAVGFNRCFSLMGLPNAPYYPANTSSQDLVDNGAWQNTSNQVNPYGMLSLIHI